MKNKNDPGILDNCYQKVFKLELMLNSWRKKLVASEIGKAKTHEAGYLNIPKKKPKTLSTDPIPVYENNRPIALPKRIIINLSLIHI